MFRPLKAINLPRRLQRACAHRLWRRCGWCHFWFGDFCRRGRGWADNWSSHLRRRRFDGGRCWRCDFRGEFGVRLRNRRGGECVQSHRGGRERRALFGFHRRAFDRWSLWTDSGVDRCQSAGRGRRMVAGPPGGDTDRTADCHGRARRRHRTTGCGTRHIGPRRDRPTRKLVPGDAVDPPELAHPTAATGLRRRT